METLTNKFIYDQLLSMRELYILMMYKENVYDKDEYITFDNFMKNLLESWIKDVEDLNELSRLAKTAASISNNLKNCGLVRDEIITNKGNKIRETNFFHVNDWKFLSWDDQPEQIKELEDKKINENSDIKDIELVKEKEFKQMLEDLIEDYKNQLKKLMDKSQKI